MKKRLRARWWIVTTHVLTTGIMGGILQALVLFVLLMSGVDIGGKYNLAAPPIGIMAFTAATFYSASYLRKHALADLPTRSTKPSIILFVVLQIIGNAIQYFSHREFAPVSIAAGLIADICIAVLFGYVTSSKFTDWQVELAKPLPQTCSSCGEGLPIGEVVCPVCGSNAIHPTTQANPITR